MVYKGISDFVPFYGDPREHRGYIAFPPKPAPEKALVMKPLLIVSPFPGTPKNTPGTSQFCPSSGTREGMVYEATSNFVPFYGDPRERRRSVVIPPILGHPKRHGL